MKEIPGRNGGTLKSWEPGESGNPKGRKKGMLHWVHKLQSKKEFNIKIEMTDEDGEVTIIDRSVILQEPAIKLAATQLLLKAVQGDMEAIRELNKMEQTTQDREAAYRSNAPSDAVLKSTPFTIIDPKTGELESISIGGGSIRQNKN